MRILLSSVGRRPYLVRWFRDALKANGVDGAVLAADVDANAPSRPFADGFVSAPRVVDPGYASWLRQTLVEHDIDLAVSINDFELSTWATLPEDRAWAPLVRLDADTQRLVEDKLATSQALVKAGVPSPVTWLGTAPPAAEEAAGPFVTKGRYGSASRGLRFVDRAGLPGALEEASGEVTTRQGVPALQQGEVPPAELIVIQERIDGVEYGLDVVCDLEGRYAGVLARRKIAMRSGETDRAVSVDAAPFESIARGIAEAIPHPGTIDVDVFVDASGDIYVIDINPRFGGGYPFSHVAGARVPECYVAWTLGREPDPAWLRCRPDVVAGKFVEIAATSEGGTGADA